MALGTFVAGPYSCTYDPPGGTFAAGDMGITEDGYQLGITYAKELIQQTDRFGDTVIDAVYRGVSAVTLNCLALEFKNPVLRAMFPYQATPMTSFGATNFDIGTVGVLDTSRAGSVILTVVAGTSAAGIIDADDAQGDDERPATLTASLAILRENHEMQWAYNSRLRKIPLSFRLLPYLNSNLYKFFDAA